MLKTFDSGCVPAAQKESGNLPMCRGSDLTMISPLSAASSKQMLPHFLGGGAGTKA